MHIGRGLSITDLPIHNGFSYSNYVIVSRPGEKNVCESNERNPIKIE